MKKLYIITLLCFISRAHGLEIGTPLDKAIIKSKVPKVKSILDTNYFPENQIKSYRILSDNVIKIRLNNAKNYYSHSLLTGEKALAMTGLTLMIATGSYTYHTKSIEASSIALFSTGAIVSIGALWALRKKSQDLQQLYLRALDINHLLLKDMKAAK